MSRVSSRPVLLAATLLVGVMALLTLVTLRAGAQEGIDISGEWNLDVAGAIPLSCTATITQSDTAFAMALSCPGLGSGDFSGSINRETGELSATGSLVSIPVNLTGTASPDGASISGSWTADLLGLSGTFTATRAGPPTTPTPLPTLPAPVDLTGTWRVEFAGVFSGTCVSVIQQTDGVLESVADCPLIGMVRLEGSLDESTGKATLTGSVDLHGVSSADGNTITGTWDAFGFLTGGFIATRADDVELLDLSGAWDVLLTGDLSDTCSITIVQSWLDASAVVDCADLGRTTFVGDANPLTGYVSLNGELAGLQIEFGLHVAEDLRYLLGGWTVAADPLGQSGGAVAVPAGRLTAGIAMLGCHYDRFVPSCSALEGTTFTMLVHVAAAPAGEYGAVQVELQWPAGVIAYQPAGDPAQEAISPGCSIVERTVLDASVVFRCQASEQAMASAGDLIALTFRCTDIGEVTVQLASRSDQGGTYFTGADQAPIDPTLIASRVSCYGPQHGGPGFVIGDTNCSYETDSVDAALVLQYEARLIDSLPCQEWADVNRDERVNSIDASLILQYTAGLLNEL